MQFVEWVHIRTGDGQMAQITVGRTGRDDLTFEGELLCCATSDPYPSEAGTRHFRLGLYSQSSGEFVVTIEYVTTCENESNFSQVETVEESKDVENVLFAFEPSEFVDRKRMYATREEVRCKLQKDLFQAYDGAVTKILDSLAEFTEQVKQQPTSDPILTSDETPRRGLLGFLARKS
jgi:hypothetical protein